MSDITILISTSPRASHPNTKVLDQTILSIRAQLPYAPIVIMADGLLTEAGPETVERYQTFISKIEGRYSDTTVLNHSSNVQQSGMIEEALKLTRTSILFYLEDDWHIHPNVEWEKLGEIIRSGFANYIRLYAGHRIHPLHEHMMSGRVIEQGVPFVKTTQWSQNPHLASTQFYYDKILPKCLERTDMIENIMHGPCASAEWEEYRLCIYNPMDEGTMNMVTHLDGKGTL